MKTIKMNIQIKFNEDAWIGLADEYKSIVKRSKQAVIKNRKFLKMKKMLAWEQNLKYLYICKLRNKSMDSFYVA